MADLTAAEVLAAAGVDQERVRAVLPRVDPATFPVRPAPAWMRRIWARGIVAFTTPWAIYVHPATLEAGLDRIGRLIVHELVHADQWRRGRIRQFVTYTASYLRRRLRGMSHGAAYLDIPQEVEARRVAASLVGQIPL